jgi:hypothetical protein
MSKKSLYRHKRSGDLFAIETDDGGNVISTSGPLLTKDLKAEELDYDNYRDEDIKSTQQKTGHSNGLFRFWTASGCIDHPQMACFALLARDESARFRCYDSFSSAL